MSVDRRLLNWGVFLVLLGGVPLAVAQGWIPRDTVANAWELWPFILIGAGIGLLLRRTPLRGLGGFIVAATFGTIFGAMLAVGVAGIGGIGIGSLGCGSAATDAPQILQPAGDVPRLVGQRDPGGELRRRHGRPSVRRRLVGRRPRDRQCPPHDHRVR